MSAIEKAFSKEGLSSCLSKVPISQRRCVDNISDWPPTNRVRFRIPPFLEAPRNTETRVRELLAKSTKLLKEQKDQISPRGRVSLYPLFTTRKRSAGDERQRRLNMKAKGA